MVRAQYAARHPLSEEPTVRFNDLAFAVHAVVLSGVAYSQFWPAIWGLQVSRAQRISKPIAALFWGSILVPILVVLIVSARSPDGGYDPSSWAWIDVVSSFEMFHSDARQSVLVLVLRHRPFPCPPPMRTQVVIRL